MRVLTLIGLPENICLNKYDHAYELYHRGDFDLLESFEHITGYDAFKYFATWSIWLLNDRIGWEGLISFLHLFTIEDDTRAKECLQAYNSSFCIEGKDISVILQNGLASIYAKRIESLNQSELFLKGFPLPTVSSPDMDFNTVAFYRISIAEEIANQIASAIAENSLMPDPASSLDIEKAYETVAINKLQELNLIAQKIILRK